jgi:hypothetical protein
MSGVLQLPRDLREARHAVGEESVARSLNLETLGVHSCTEAASESDVSEIAPFSLSESGENAETDGVVSMSDPSQARSASFVDSSL